MLPKEEYQILADRELAIIREREELEDELAPIKNKVVSAHMQRRNTGRYVPDHLYREVADQGEKLQAQIKKLNVEMLIIQRRMGILHRANVFGATNITTPLIERRRQMFIEVAKQQLSEDAFERIWQIVEGRLKLMNNTKSETVDMGEGK